MRPFGEVQSKATRAYAQSGQYHTILESRVRLTMATFHFHTLLLFLTSALQFTNDTFDAVVDKGGLDALMEPEVGSKLGSQYLSEVLI